MKLKRIVTWIMTLSIICGLFNVAVTATASENSNFAYITVLENSVEASITAPIRDDNNECDVYIALYNSDGMLVKVGKEHIESADTDINVSVDTTGLIFETSNIKAFVWDSNMKPLGDLQTEIVIEPDETTVPEPVETTSPEPVETSSPEPDVVYTDYSWDFSDQNQLGSGTDVNNTPYLTGGAVYSDEHKNIQLNSGGVGISFNPALTDETITIEFDLYLGAVSKQSTGYTIESSNGNILTLNMNEYDGTGSYIKVGGDQIAGSDINAYRTKVNADGMGASPTHFINKIDLKNGIATVTIKSGQAQGEFSGTFNASDITSFTITSNHTSRSSYLDNITIKGSESENLIKPLSDYADELAPDAVIYGDLYMPAEYKDVRIEWSSNSPAVTASGEVTRGETDVPVEIKMVISRGEETLEQTYSCIVKAMPEELDDMEAYLFVHFIGTESTADEEQIYFSISEDGQTWETINSGNPVLKSDVGEKGVRDPHIIRSPEGDRFFLIATDLSIYNRRDDANRWATCQKSGSKSIIVWESNDLVNWSDARKVQIAPDNAGCTWAPESVFNENVGEYMVFWASKVSTDSFKYQRVYKSYTRDFKHFSKPEIYIDNATEAEIAAGTATDNIDTTILEDNGIYYRFTKNESKSSVIMEKGTDLDGTFESVGTYTLNGKAGNSVTGYEGPTAYKMNGENKWCLLLDAYASKGGYKPFITDDISKGEFVSGSDFNFDAKYRHGTVMPITKKEYEALKSEYAEKIETKYLADQLMYSSGKNQLGASEAESGREHNTINADGSMLYAGTVNFDNLKSITMRYGFGEASGNTAKIEVYAYGGEDDSPQNPNSFDMEKVIAEGTKIAGVSTQKTSGWGYTTQLFTETDVKETEDTKNNFEISSFSPLSANGVGKKGLYIYITGKTDSGANTSFYVNYLATAVIAETEETTSTVITAVSGDGIKSLSVDINEDKKSVYIPVSLNTDIETLSPQFTVSNGGTAQLTEGTYENGIITVTAEGISERWTVTAQKVGNPLVDGYYADPNIAVFGNKFYIYPTCDGNEGWGSTYFKCFSSDNLVDWKDEGTILDLSDVSWSMGKYGWAPTIAEKNGKYYYYFSSGMGKDGSTKGIGVAVADSPTGPFVDSGKAITSSGRSIDPCVFIDDDGQAYMYWGNGYLYVSKLSDDMLSLEGETKTITPSNYTEAPFVFKRNGKYYVSWSQNDTGDPAYCVHYGTMDSPMGSITGNTVILSYENTDNRKIRGTGHHSVVNVPNTDDWYICYHRVNMALYGNIFGRNTAAGNHRELCLDKMTFDNDGNINVITATTAGITEPVTIPENNE